VPLYTQVSFSNIRYSEAYKNGKRQEKIMQQIMKIPNIKEIWNSKEIEEKIISMI
jgi:kynurenine 3-monooxygenase